MNCEACQTATSSVYCLGCKKHFCISCETNRHPSTHTTVPSQSQIKCKDHEEPFTMFCETCSLMLCSLCIPIHHSAYHQLKPLIDVYRIQSSQLQALLSQRGYSKKKLLELRIEERNRNIGELSKACGLLENEINETHSSMLRRLELYTAPVVSQLSKEQASVHADVETMEQALELVKGNDMILFLQNYKKLINDLVMLANKQLPPESEFDVSSIPTELMEWRNRSRALQRLETLNQAKNEILWDIMSGEMRNSEGTAKREILQWSRLTDKYLDRLSNMQLFCYFCKVPIDETNVNTFCRMNQRDHSAPFFAKDPHIPPKHLGTGFHYFVKIQDIKQGYNQQV
ncbi:unnamed protein product [Blepharisma stoltei]|uniref:B box-type domain-containing protein n=1 Tax=Blepharisma stoltei TaxID=1481888 RepID=A0AAU9K6Y4_9CILI|nr:unnamed protein product [Blepharisma stoltei]